jgi:fumarate hydratase subunit beta
MNYSFTVDELIEKIATLRVGDQVLLTGTIYTARDAAHQRLSALLAEGKPLPVPLQNLIIYYCGPCPAKPGDAIGSCGPTTATRMDGFTPQLLSLGVKATIGKGPRSAEVRQACAAYQALYLVATGGVAALLARKVRRCEPVAFEDLGPEAIYRLEVLDFPLIVAYDNCGNDIFQKPR